MVEGKEGLGSNERKGERNGHHFGPRLFIFRRNIIKFSEVSSRHFHIMKQIDPTDDRILLSLNLYFLRIADLVLRNIAEMETSMKM